MSIPRGANRMNKEALYIFNISFHKDFYVDLITQTQSRDKRF